MTVTEDVPAELWLTIFELMDSPVDLNSVVRTCRRFHSYGIRALHRTLVWKRPEDFVQNSALWVADSGMAPGVRSLELHISTLPDDVPGTLVDLNGFRFYRDAPGHFPEFEDEPFWLFPEVDQQIFSQSTMHSINYYKMHHSYANAAVYGKLIQRLPSFTNLRSLTLKNLFITDDLFGSLFHLPSLRHLHVEFCLFPRKQVTTPRDFSALPITNLTLLNLRRQVMSAGRNGHDLHAFADMDEDIEYGLALASAQGLQTLRVDSTADVFATIYRRRQQGVYVYNIPPSLSSLYVQRKQVVDGAVQPLFHAEQLFPGAVYSIMERCPTLTTISLAYTLPKHSSFPKSDSLPNLTYCEGFLDAVSAMSANRPLKAISVLRSDTSTEGILDFLQRKAKQHPGLEMLALHCKTWDLEILYAICQLFPELRKLKLTFDIRLPGKIWEHVDYWHGIQPYEMYEALEEARARPEFASGSRGPEEDTVVSIGPHYLYRLKHLHTAHIFATPSNGGKPDHPKFLYDNTYADVEEELQNLVIPWNRYCKSLREVQLHAGYAMRRAYEGDGWKMREVKEVRENCDFAY
ncbi:hypothetical protein PHLGIDRAFT_123068 [Phlebiopsis gigantea 11061_1 CR5-6]|uniref:F-box domain-containing protein n=1 Tax=Phlebiopsis gigantea (strain 11061_1 CR5-6) TaxID=745531 RepID=A0A0C3S2D1_PHLG1|nr:hypothetical protein PHLGIDRAFT_123068 [Phlebiopsis gigantea 11061_1 CR5-6]